MKKLHVLIAAMFMFCFLEPIASQTGVFLSYPYKDIILQHGEVEFYNISWIYIIPTEGMGCPPEDPYTDYTSCPAYKVFCVYNPSGNKRLFLRFGLNESECLRSLIPLNGTVRVTVHIVLLGDDMRIIGGVGLAEALIHSNGFADVVLERECFSDMP